MKKKKIKQKNVLMHFLLLARFVLDDSSPLYQFPCPDYLVILLALKALK